ncbi:MAG: hypothetical protein WA629_10030 [Candidatus Aquilonibacter sp.]
MSIPRSRTWDVTAIEIALDLEAPRLADPPCFVFSGPAEPRICLVAGFALTSQLRRLIAAVDRALPSRLPSHLRVAPAKLRSLSPAMTNGLALAPMPTLLRMQSKFIRAIEPGLAPSPPEVPVPQHMDEAAERFIRDFVPSKALPTFEPPRAERDFEAIELRTTGITLYRLGERGATRSILSHWSYVDGSIHP